MESKIWRAVVSEPNTALILGLPLNSNEHIGSKTSMFIEYEIQMSCGIDTPI